MLSKVDILSHLNPAQREAVVAIAGPVLIIAGPGSGKTRVIAHRIAYLIREIRLSPQRIMAVTFTNKAAQEMKRRVESLLGESAGDITLGTFHAIAAGILRRHGERIGLDSSFVIYDEEDSTNLIKHCLEELDIDHRQFPPRAVASAIRAAKSRLITPKQLSRTASSYFEEIVARVYERYEQRLLQSRAADFDDLLLKTVLLFREHQDILNRYQSRYIHVMIDEFQDTNPVQYELAKLVSGKYRNLCVVGDPDQSIYAWRYADIRNILNFEQDFPDARVIYLEQNYRSTRVILESASRVIAANKQRKPKNLWTENEAGDPVTVVEALSEQEEARFVAAEVERLNSIGVPLRECAVMYRTNAQSRVLEETLMRYGIPYKLVGALRFYQRREVKDILAYLRLLHNPDDDVSLTRIINVPPRGIGPRTLAQLSHLAERMETSLFRALETLQQTPAFQGKARQVLSGFARLIEELREKSRELPLTALFDDLIERVGYRDYILREPDGEERWENIRELRRVAQESEGRGEGLTGFLEGVSLVSDVDNLDEQAEAVTLITLHQAKGLEFDAVFITGMEEGILPHYKSLSDPDQMEEERRLCYVGMTRARRYLYLLYSQYRPLGGANAPRGRSRFLLEIPPELTVRVYPEGEGFTAMAPPPAEFRVGDKVRHPQFGEGVVITSTVRHGDLEVVVAFKEAGLKKLLLSLTALEKVA